MTRPYGSAVFDNHAQLLAESAVSEDVAAARGYRSADNKAQLKRYGFGPVQQNPPGLLIPLHSVTGEQRGWQFRPDHPRSNDRGRPIKYETPRFMKLVLDVPPPARDRVVDADVPLWVTEGVRKADSAVSAGLACIALLGVWNWRDSDGLLSDWEYIPLKDRRVLIAFDSDVMMKPEVHQAMARLAAVLTSRRADVGFVYLPSGDGGAKVGLDDYLAAGHDVGDVMALVTSELRRPVTDQPDTEEEDTFDDVPDEPLSAVLDDLATFLRRFVAFPYTEAAAAVALWIAMTWAIIRIDLAPRLVLTSAEKQSGKTRVMELVHLTARGARLTSGVSSSYLFRIVEAEHPTLLVDEADTIFGRKARKASSNHEDLRGLINAGFARGATVGRMEGEGAAMVPKDYSVFSPVALAGIGKLPETVVDRAVVLRMRRRGPGETVEHFRRRRVAPQAERLRRRIAAAVSRLHDDVFDVDPAMPDGIVDRPADVWEPLLQLADAAGGDWSARGRAACVASNNARQGEDESYGVQLLVDIAAAFDDQDVDRLKSSDLADALRQIETSPWRDMDANGLARRLRHFDVKPKQMKIDAKNVRGYDRDDFHDAWSRYLPAPGGYQPATPLPDTHPIPETPTVTSSFAESSRVAANGEGGAGYRDHGPLPPDGHPRVVRL